MQRVSIFGSLDTCGDPVTFLCVSLVSPVGMADGRDGCVQAIVEKAHQEAVCKATKQEMDRYVKR